MVNIFSILPTYLTYILLLKVAVFLINTSRQTIVNNLHSKNADFGWHIYLPQFLPSSTGTTPNITNPIEIPDS
jgi:hypothetical protein